MHLHFEWKIKAKISLAVFYVESNDNETLVSNCFMNAWYSVAQLVFDKDENKFGYPDDQSLNLSFSVFNNLTFESTNSLQK